MDTIFNILVAILAFSFVVFFHELCHFLMAKAVKIKAKEFSVGFGRSMVAYQKGKFYFFPSSKEKPYDLNEISYHLKILPFGGYVLFDRPQIVDGKVVSEDYLHSFHPFKRILVLLAGPLGNIALGLALFFLFFSQQAGVGPENEIQKITPNSYAVEIGLQEKDLLLGVNGSKEFHLEDIKKGLKENEFCLTYSRGGDVKEFCETQTEERELLGVTMGYPLTTFISEGTVLYGNLLVEYARSFINIIFQLDIKSMNGPVGIIDAVQESVPVWSEFLTMMIILNVALGIANLLFPLSITDGGRIMVDLVCWIRGKKKISTRYLDIASVLIILSIFTITTFFDLQRLFEKIGWFG